MRRYQPTVSSRSTRSDDRVNASAQLAIRFDGCRGRRTRRKQRHQRRAKGRECMAAPHSLQSTARTAIPAGKVQLMHVGDHTATSLHLQPRWS